jgi:hypothetical protein
MQRKETGDDNPHSELIFEHVEAEEKKVIRNRERERIFHGSRDFKNVKLLYELQSSISNVRCRVIVACLKFSTSGSSKH